MNRYLSYLLLAVITLTGLAPYALADQPAIGFSTGGSAGSSGAATSEPFVTIGNVGTLSAERAITGTANLITVTDGGANSTVTLNVGSLVLRTDTDQTVTGNKTFPNTGLRLLDTLGDHYTTIKQNSDEAANRIANVPALGADDTFGMIGQAQTWAAVQTFSATPVLSTAAITANGDTITIQDLGNANLVQSEGAQTINGVKTFVSTPVLSSAAVTANGDTISIQDLGNANLVQSEGAQTINGVKTMGSANVITHANTGLKVLDTGGDHSVTIAPSSNEAADRTVSLPTLGGAHTLVTESATQTLTGKSIAGTQLTGTANHVVIYSGSGTGSSVAPGTSGNVLTSNGTSWTSSAASSGGIPFGGSGVRTAPTSGTLTGEYWHSGDWNTSGAITCNRCRIHVDGNVTIDEAITVSTEIAGGTGTTGAGGGFGQGLGFGTANVGLAGSGGGGGANGGAGGNGGAIAAGREANGGKAYFLENYLGGSSGATGQGDGSVAGGGGGAAGGGFYLEVDGTVTVATGGTITASGGAGSAGSSNSAGGGGGSGGTIDVRATGTITISNNVTWTASGGNGGNGAGTGGGGGGGGGGIISVKSGTITETGTLTLTVSGGTAGTGGLATATNGSAGTSDKTAVLYSVRSAN